MTVANNYAPLRQLGNGSTTVFSGSWSMIAAAYAVVQLESVTTGVRTPVTQGPGSNQYQITITSSGFTVTFGTAPSSSYYVDISRKTGLDQTNSYTTSSGFQGQVEENSFDKLTAAVQDAAYAASQAITIPTGESYTTVLPSAALRANKFLGFDSSGNVTVSNLVTTGTLYANVVSATPSVVDTNVLLQGTYSVNSYLQFIIQNTNAGAAASTDYVVNNNLGTANTFFGNFGMNSSGYTGSGSFNKASAVYLSSTSGDLVVGTTTANAIRFVYNNGTTDSAFIDATGFNAAKIIMNGSPVFDKVAVQSFNTSGTYTPTAGMAYCIVETWGGGGGGGGIVGGATSSGGGGGGGAGSYSRRYLTAAQIGVSQTVTIGAAGSAGAAGNNAGGAGGTTSVGALCISNGGGGGGGSGGQNASSGPGGSTGTGDVVSPGQAGGPGSGGTAAIAPIGTGSGGNSIVGAGGQCPLSNNNGNSATGFGAGGSGGTANSTTSSFSGGPGVKGYVVITEFLSA